MWFGCWVVNCVEKCTGNGVNCIGLGDCALEPATGRNPSESELIEMTEASLAILDFFFLCIVGELDSLIHLGSHILSVPAMIRIMSGIVTTKVGLLTFTLDFSVEFVVVRIFIIRR